RAFGQQREILGFDAEFEIERPRGPDAAVEGHAGGARAHADRVEFPVLAALDHVARTGGGHAAKSPGDIAEREIEVFAAEGRAAGRELEVQRAIQALPQSARIETAHVAFELPALPGIPARITGELCLAVEGLQRERVDPQLLLVERAAQV